MPSPPCYDRITWTSDAEGLFKGLRPSFTSSALIKEVLGEWRACRGAFTLSRNMFGTVRPSGSPVLWFTLPTPLLDPNERYLDCSFHSLWVWEGWRDGGMNDNLCSNSASLFVWVYIQRCYLPNKSRCVRVNPVLQLDSASLHSWWINWFVQWILIHSGLLNWWEDFNQSLFMYFTALLENSSGEIICLSCKQPFLKYLNSTWAGFLSPMSPLNSDQLWNHFRHILQWSEESFDLTVLSASQMPHGGVKEFFCSPIKRLFTLSPATCDH